MEKGREKNNNNNNNNKTRRKKEEEKNAVKRVGSNSFFTNWQRANDRQAYMIIMSLCRLSAPLSPPYTFTHRVDFSLPSYRQHQSAAIIP